MVKGTASNESSCSPSDIVDTNAIDNQMYFASFHFAKCLAINIAVITLTHPNPCDPSGTCHVFVLSAVCRPTRGPVAKCASGVQKGLGSNPLEALL
ncbi:hypothetical protein CEXT_156661 [Caerostris extrusa]|uniref:Uncharacterized protein n=1 Tax=Caerostris extrusa TaxID=172846 RepID=A0AAV4W5X8_CAEEX|nr:hypothetical protein CEXT_156661 [Caerostris extrusa]